MLSTGTLAGGPIVQEEEGHSAASPVWFLVEPGVGGRQRHSCHTREAIIILEPPGCEVCSHKGLCCAVL